MQVYNFMEYYLGIDIGGTFIKYGIVDMNYNIINKWKVPTQKFDNKDKFYDYICSNIKEDNNTKIIGVSAPGLIDDCSNVKSYGSKNVQDMYNTNINFEIRKRTQKNTISINDAKAAGLCEIKLGNAKYTKISAFLIIGTGIGGCICNDSVIYGKDGFAGEFHHIPFLDLRNNSIKSQGDYCSINALLNIYSKKAKSNYNIEQGKYIIEKYLENDKIAKSSVEEWIKNIVILLLTIAVFYNPEVICIGGGISEEEWFIELIKEKYSNMLYKYFNGIIPITTEIKKCKYNNDANILGAILNALNKLEV